MVKVSAALVAAVLVYSDSGESRPAPPLPGHGGSGFGFPLNALAAATQSGWTPREIKNAETQLGSEGSAIRHGLSPSVEPFLSWVERARATASTLRIAGLPNPLLFGKDEDLPFLPVQKLVRNKDNFCTATLVRNDLFVTNRHCLEINQDNELPEDFFETTFFQIGNPTSQDFSYQVPITRVQWSDSPTNFAVVQLSQPVGDVLGFFGIFWTQSHDYQSMHSDINYRNMSSISWHSWDGTTSPALNATYDCRASPVSNTEISAACKNTRLSSGSPVSGTSWYSCKPENAPCSTAECVTCTFPEDDILQKYPPYLYGLWSGRKIEGVDTFVTTVAFRDSLYEAVESWPRVNDDEGPTDEGNGPGQGDEGVVDDGSLDPVDSFKTDSPKLIPENYRRIIYICLAVAAALSFAVGLVALHYVFMGKPLCCARCVERKTSVASKGDDCPDDDAQSQGSESVEDEDVSPDANTTTLVQV